RAANRPDGREAPRGPARPDPIPAAAAGHGGRAPPAASRRAWAPRPGRSEGCLPGAPGRRRPPRAPGAPGGRVRKPTAEGRPGSSTGDSRARDGSLGSGGERTCTARLRRASSEENPGLEAQVAAEEAEGQEPGQNRPPLVAGDHDPADADMVREILLRPLDRDPSGGDGPADASREPEIVGGQDLILGSWKMAIGRIKLSHGGV